MQCTCVGAQAAGAIHTDFERGFICAEVMHYDELHELGTESAARAAGKYRQEVSSAPQSVCPQPGDQNACNDAVRCR